MPHISNKRLHTLDYMSRVLSCAGQFAHVSRKNIEQSLSALYHAKRPNDGGYCKDAVSDELIRLHNARVIPRMYYAEGTMDYIAHQFGALCPLCHCTQGGLHGGRMLSFLVSPHYLNVLPETHEYRGALCYGCYSSILDTFGRGPWWHEDRNMLIAGLARLVGLESFRKRTRLYKRTQLRFDPCRLN